MYFDYDIKSDERSFIVIVCTLSYLYETVCYFLQYYAPTNNIITRDYGEADVS